MTPGCKVDLLTGVYCRDFWRYFEPPREYMPRNCSADVEAVIAHVDEVFTSGIQTDIDALKLSFGMGNLTHLDDVASYRAYFEWLTLCDCG
jgi:hypothetical protein